VDAVTPRKLEISVKRIATVSGRIVNRAGGPSADANVALLSMAYVDGRQALRVLRNATSDNDGNFRFIEIPSGDYYVRVEQQMPRTIAYYPGAVDPSGAQS
jgi:sugar/nucleoside kinase (ribokinase family)